MRKALFENRRGYRTVKQLANAIVEGATRRRLACHAEAMEARVLLSVPQDAEFIPGVGYALSDDLLYMPPQALTGSSAHVASPPAGQRPYGAQYADGSEYMSGNVYVTVVLLESNGASDTQTENWTASEINQVKTKITEGLTWWQTMYANRGYTGSLSFNIDFTNADTPFQTSYEPINRPYTDQYLWINQFLGSKGAYSGHTGVQQFNDDRRLATNSDWAYTIFVADSSVDADGKFTDGWFGYAYLGGPFIQMTYDNDGWGIGGMGKVTAHETGHIFYALDEYPGAGTYTEHSGYYNTQNLNASDGNPNPTSRVASIMGESALQHAAYADYTSSPTSLQMIGWQDADGDHIIDVLDQSLTLTGTSGAFNASTNKYTFSCTSAVRTLTNLNPIGNSNDITLNEADYLQYRVDGGVWTNVNASAYGTFSQTFTSIQVDTPTLWTLIEFRTIAGDSSATSAIFSDTSPYGDVLGPRVTAHTPSGEVYSAQTSMEFAFNEVMDSGSFAIVDDLVSFTGPGGVDLRSQITGFSWVNTQMLRVQFTRQSAKGAYAMVIGPNITDGAPSPNPMDQDGDAINGEVSGDRYTGSLTVVPLYMANMDYDPGWTFDPGTAPYQWQYGTPTGSGGDPTSGHTGSNVIGYNLAGQYPNSLSTPQYATTPAFSTLGHTDVKLSFWRWLGIGSLDNASVQVWDGSTWTTVLHSSSLQDSSWHYQECALPAWASNKTEVSIRWAMGPTDNSATYCGWNIDDVMVTGIPIGIGLDFGDAPETPATASLFTTLAAGLTRAGAMFDITALNTVTINSFDGHAEGTNDWRIYYKVGTHVGFETNPAAWALLGIATNVVSAPWIVTPIPIATNVIVPAGQTYSFYITVSTNSTVNKMVYTRGTGVGNVFSFDANLQLHEGVGNDYPFGVFANRRVFNGAVHYTTFDGGGDYHTTAANNGARHTATGPFLGLRRDAEANGRPSYNADGDDLAGTPSDEDGVVFATPLVAGANATIQVMASAASRLDAWIDFNSDGDWSDAGEKIFNSMSLTAGINNLVVAVPAGATVTARTFARFRLSSAGGLSYEGPANDGELEDYAVAIVQNHAPTDLNLSASSIPENQPANTVVGTLSTIDADIWDTFTYSLVSGDGSADNASFTISGSTLRTAAIFDFLAKSTYSIRVRSTDLAGFSCEKAFTITVTDATAPQVISTSINDGAAQRSMVKTITVVFSEEVNLTDSPLKVIRRDGSAIPDVTVTAANPLLDKMTWELTFEGPAAIGDSLPDGTYRLVVTASGVADLAGNVMTVDFSRSFHRLFGDSDGDRDVDSADLMLFRRALNNPANYSLYSYFDYNGDGNVTQNDYQQFKQRLTRRILK